MRIQGGPKRDRSLLVCPVPDMEHKNTRALVVPQTHFAVGGNGDGAKCYDGVPMVSSVSLLTPWCPDGILCYSHFCLSLPSIIQNLP